MKGLRGNNPAQKMSVLGGHYSRGSNRLKGSHLGLRQRQRQKRNLHSSARKLFCLLPSLRHVAVLPVHLDPQHLASLFLPHQPFSHNPNPKHLLRPHPFRNSTHPPIQNPFSTLPHPNLNPLLQLLPKNHQHQNFTTHSRGPAIDPSEIHISLSTTHISIYPSTLPFLTITCSQPSNPNTHSFTTAITHPCHSCLSLPLFSITHSFYSSNPSNTYLYPPNLCSLTFTTSLSYLPSC